ncbi:MAG: hypothetical protein IPK10_16680 [Bacteroidetes bacterium]|nr:hypothetical protein [Bacteroidota bacterium]
MMKNRMIITLQPVIILFMMMGLNILNATAVGFSCSPHKINLHANFGSVTICVMGDSVHQMNEFAFLKMINWSKKLL